MDKKFRFETKLIGNKNIFSFSGEFAADSFKNVVDQIEKDFKRSSYLKFNEMIFDLTKIDHLSSYGIKTLIVAHKRAVKENCKFYIVARLGISKILHGLKLDNIMNILLKQEL